MDVTSPFQAFLIFLLSAALSGVLSGVKTVIGFFSGQNTEHALSGESAYTQAVIARSQPVDMDSPNRNRRLIQALDDRWKSRPRPGSLSRLYLKP